MSVRNGLAFWRVCILGALNGLLYGELADIVYRIGIWYEVDSWDITLNYLLRLSPLPFVMAFFFMASSCLVHRYWLSRPESLLVLWQVIGFAAVNGFVFVMLIIKPVHLSRWDFLMRWFVGLILVAFVNLIYGLVIQLAARHYLHEKSSG